MAKSGPILYRIFSMLLSFVLLTHSAPETALVTQLPGFSGTFPSKHYSGYFSFLLPCHFSTCIEFLFAII